MKTRVIICAAGGKTRWNNYQGTGKQYVRFCGVPLLQRTINQVRGFGGVSDVLVTSLEAPPVPIAGAEFVKPRPDLSPMPDSGSGNTFGFWTRDPEDCNVILFGDVYYSPFCMQNIFVSAANSNAGGMLGLHYFGRRGGGHNGKGWGEIFAWYVKGAAARGRWAEALAEVKCSKREGERITSWEILDFLQDRIDYYWTEIRDETEDFDFPNDLDTWIKLYPGLWNGHSGIDPV